MNSDGKKCLILHIGTEKTGTTSIQNVLSINRSLLRANGVVFPRSLGPVNHTLLAAACLDDGVVDNIKAHQLARGRCHEEEFRRRVKCALAEELGSGPAWSSLIVSTELIHSRLTQSSEIDRLWSILSPFVDEVKLVVFLRRQDEQAVSRFSSVLRAGHSGFGEIFEDLGGHFYLKVPDGRNISDFKQYYDYRRLLERFRHVVRAEDMVVRCYDDFRRAPGVVGEFLEIANLSHLELQDCRSDLNRSMSARAQFLMSAVNEMAKPWHKSGLRNLSYKELQKLIERENGGEPREVPRAEAQRFSQRFAESNEWVRAKFFPQRRSLFSDDFSGYPESVDYTGFESDLAPLISRYRGAAKRIPIRRIPSTAARAFSAVLGRARVLAGSVRNQARFLWLRGRCEIRHLARVSPRIFPLGDDRPRPEFEFAIARILGSDHFPRHGSNQTLTNLLFTLDHEPEFEGCVKFYVVNRIFDQKSEEAILDLLNSRGVPYVHIPFLGSEYSRNDWDTSPFGGIEYFSSKEFHTLEPALQDRDRCLAAAPKIQYAMNVNGARNAALEEGATRAEWTLALDGNCVLTEAGFRELRRSARSYPRVPYLVLPMTRLTDNEDYFQPADYGRKSAEEPQIAIHRSASERYDERLPYGFRDKVELLMRLGVPGPWLRWSQPSWQPAGKVKSPGRGLYKFSRARVLRLSSGKEQLDAVESGKARYRARNKAILKSLEYLDRKFSCTNREAERRILGGAHGPARHDTIIPEPGRSGRFIPLALFRKFRRWRRDRS